MLDKQKLIDKMLMLYAYRANRDTEGLVKSAFMSLYNDMCEIIGEREDFEAALCAIYWRANGNHDKAYLDIKWHKVSPQTEKAFLYCHECKCFGRSRHTLACSELKKAGY